MGRVCGHHSTGSVIEDGCPDMLYCLRYVCGTCAHRRYKGKMAAKFSLDSLGTGDSSIEATPRCDR